MKRSNGRTGRKKHWYNNSANPYSKHKSWEDIIYREKSEKKKKNEKPGCLLDLSPELRGPAQNRWGGHVNSNIKKCRGTFGKANKGRSLTQVEKQKWAHENGFDLVQP